MVYVGVTFGLMACEGAITGYGTEYAWTWKGDWSERKRAACNQIRYSSGMLPFVFL